MISWKRALLFNRERLVSNEGGGFIFRLSGWGGGGGHPIGVIGFDGRQGVSKKKSWEWGVVPPMPPPHHGIP